MNEKYLQPITHVAIVQDDVTYSLPKPNRHHNVIRMMMGEHGCRGDAEQGFLLEDGTFVRRKPAGRIAIKTGQIEKLNWGNQLYSEDLW